MVWGWGDGWKGSSGGALAKSQLTRKTELHFSKAFSERNIRRIKPMPNHQRLCFLLNTDWVCCMNLGKLFYYERKFT